MNAEINVSGVGNVGSRLQAEFPVVEFDAGDVTDRGLRQDHFLRFIAAIGEGVDEHRLSPQKGLQQGRKKATGELGFNREVAIHAGHGSSFCDQHLSGLERDEYRGKGRFVTNVVFHNL